jgi:hypothetical protein
MTIEEAAAQAAADITDLAISASKGGTPIHRGYFRESITIRIKEAMEAALTEWPSPRDLATLRAALLVKTNRTLTPDDYKALAAGLPQRRAVQMSTSDTADFVIRRFLGEDSETQFFQRAETRAAPTKDIDREG